MKRFALTDCNNFYCSCERVFNPVLHGQPVVVLSNNDGCIVARSQEAKALNIKMGTPVFQIRELLSRHQVQVYSSNYTLYGDMSLRVMETLAQFTPRLEVYSIDEAFLDLSGFAGQDLTEYGQSIRQRVLQWTGIPVSVGIGSTKTLSKIANDIAKHSGSGVFDLTTHNLEAVLEAIAVEDIWGIGRNYGRALRSQGIETALQLREADLKWIKQRYNVVVQRIVYELREHSCLPLELVAPPRKSLMVSRSFGQPVTTLAHLKEARGYADTARVATYTSRAAEKLRQHRLMAGVMSVFAMTSRFGETPYSDSMAVSLPVPTNDTAELLGYALRCGERLYQSGYEFIKAGVLMQQLVLIQQRQMNLFDDRDRERYERLMLTMDQINAQFGAGTIRFAATGLQQPWKLKAARLSERYTTSWKEIPIVAAK
jgi:DNA polymerase V